MAAPRTEARAVHVRQFGSENDLDNVIRAAQAEDLKLVLRVDGAPDWAGGPSKASADAVESFYAAMASHAKGAVVGYEVLNEPNLPFEWGGTPSPSGYAQFPQGRLSRRQARRSRRAGDRRGTLASGGQRRLNGRPRIPAWHVRGRRQRLDRRPGHPQLRRQRRAGARSGRLRHLLPPRRVVPSDHDRSGRQLPRRSGPPSSAGCWTPATTWASTTGCASPPTSRPTMWCGRFAMHAPTGPGWVA